MPEPDPPAEELERLFGLAAEQGEAWLSAARSALEPLPPLGTIGSYELVEELGRGGQGTVYKARQPGTGRLVALKRLGTALVLGGRARERFQREIDALTRLAHPNVVTIHAFEVLEGHAILVMEWVDGVPIDRWARRGDPRALREVLAVFLDVCEAVAHAHRRGVLHRDLKPSNVLVDRAGRARVLDFGLAKLIEPEALDYGTQSTGFLGTPAFAPPEQIEGRWDAVDTRSDVYSLGVVLFTLVAGGPPFDGGLGFAALFERVRQGRAERPERLRAAAGREIEAIVLKAMARDPDERYQSVEGLLEDLRRHLSGETVLAHPPSAAYRLRKTFARHRLAVWSTLGALVATLLFSVAITLLALNERAAKEDARWNLYVAAVAAADGAQRIVHSDEEARVRLDQAPAELRGWEWEHLRAQLDRSLLATTVGGRVWSCAFSPDGRTIALGTWGGQAQEEARLELCDARSGELRRVFRLDGPTPWCLAYAPDGSQVALGTGDRNVYLIDPSSGTPTRTLGGLSAAVRCLAWSPDGTLLAGGPRYRDSALTARVWSVKTGDIVAQIKEPGGFDALAFAAQGQRLATAGGGRVKVFELAPVHEVAHCEGSAGVVNVLLFRADGKELVAGTADGRVLRWDPETGRALGTFAKPEAGGCLALDPQRGTALFSSNGNFGGTNSLTAWDFVTGAKRGEYVGHRYSDGVTAAAFAPDGARVAAATWEGELRVWDASGSPLARRWIAHDAAVNALDVGPGGWLASASADGTLRIWEPGTGTLVSGPWEAGTPLHAVAFAPSDKVYCGGEDGLLREWDVRGGLRDVLALEGGPLRALDVGRERVLAGSADGALRSIDPARSALVATWPLFDRPIIAVRLSPDERWIACAADPVPPAGTPQPEPAVALVVLDARDGRLVRELGPAAHAGFALAWSADATKLCCGGYDNVLRAWRADSWELVSAVAYTSGGYRYEAIAPLTDGSRWVLANSSPPLRVWHEARGQELFALRGIEGRPLDVVCGPADRWIAAASKTGEIVVWESAPSSATLPARTLERLLAEHGRSSAVLDELRLDAGLSEETRAEALGLALQLGLPSGAPNAGSGAASDLGAR